MMKLLAISLLTATMLASCDVTSGPDIGGEGRSVEISRKDLGQEWPLTVETGQLSCSPPKAIVFQASDQAYTVNEAAHEIRRTREKGWQDIKVIRAKEPGSGDLKDLGPLIQSGLSLCS